MQSNKKRRMSFNPLSDLYRQVGPPARSRSGPNPQANFKLAPVTVMWTEETLSKLNRNGVANAAKEIGMRVNSKTTKKAMIEQILAEQED